MRPHRGPRCSMGSLGAAPGVPRCSVPRRSGPSARYVPSTPQEGRMLRPPRPPGPWGTAGVRALVIAGLCSGINYRSRLMPENAPWL